MKDHVHAAFASTGSWIGNIYDLTIVTYIYAELEKSYHVGLGVVSLLFALGLIGRFFGGLYLGNLTDKVGARRVMAMSTAGYAIFASVMAFSPDVIILLSARFIQGIFMGGEWTSGTLLGYEFSPANIRSTIFGLIQSGYGIGYALTGVAYILFLPTIAVTWRYFLITGTIPLIIVPYTMLKIPRDKKEIQKLKEKINLWDYKVPMIKSMIMMSGFFSAYFAVLSFYPTIAPSFGLSRSLVGIIMIISSLTIAIWFIIFGRLASIFRKKHLIMGGSVIAMVFAWLTMPYFDQIRFLALPGMLVFTFGIGSMPLVPLLLMNRINPAVRGVISGISYNFGALFGGLMSVLLGIIGGIVGTSRFILIIDITTLVCLLSVFITSVTIKKVKESASYLSGLSGNSE